MALIAGPTASGKSDLAVELALEIERRGGRARVLNADSAQVYRDLRVLSARPAPEDMRSIEHRLFGMWDGAEPCSAADWAALAKREIENAHLESVVPIVVGGTGLYIRTLLEGIAPVPEIDPEIRRQVRALEPDAAWKALCEEDPLRSAVLEEGDRARIMRALEVVRSTGCSLARWQDQRRGGIGSAIELHALRILPDRSELYERCNARFADMLEHGAREEVETLLERRLSPDLPVMRAIGVPEISAWIRGDLTREEAVQRGQQATRNYAKRQYTWFRRQPPEHWPTQEKLCYSDQGHFDALFRSLRLT